MLRLGNATRPFNPVCWRLQMAGVSTLVSGIHFSSLGERALSRRWHKVIFCSYVARAGSGHGNARWSLDSENHKNCTAHINTHIRSWHESQVITGSQTQRFIFLDIRIWHQKMIIFCYLTGLEYLGWCNKNVSKCRWIFFFSFLFFPNSQRSQLPSVVICFRCVGASPMHQLLHAPFILMDREKKPSTTKVTVIPVVVNTFSIDSEVRRIYWQADCCGPQPVHPQF